MLNIDLKALTDNEFNSLRWAVIDEKKRRESIPEIEEALNEAAEEYHEANPPEVADEGIPVWKQPFGAFDAWPVGAEVMHNGKRWRNLLSKVNVWEPGNDGPVPTWEVVVIEPEGGSDGQTPPVDTETPPDVPSVAEWTTGVAYVPGDVVTYAGESWTALQGHTSLDGWEPPNVPALWKSEGAIQWT